MWGSPAGWGSTFLLTTTNPMTILAFAAKFSALVGMVSFKETLNVAELAGMAMAIGSVFLLVRFG